MIVTAYYRKCYSSLSSAWISNFPLSELFSICLFTKFPKYDVNIKDNTNLPVCNHLSKGVIYLAKMELHVWQKAIYLNILWCDQNHAPFQAIPSKLFPGNARNPLQTDGRTVGRKYGQGWSGRRADIRTDGRNIQGWSVGRTDEPTTRNHNVSGAQRH